MQMQGEELIAESPQRVWEALNDTEVLKACIPGCDSIERTEDDRMQATVTLRVGPIKASFKGEVTLSDIEPPHGYTISGQGSGGAVGGAKGSARVRLAAAEGGTMLSYDVTSQVSGKVAQLGARLIDSTAKKLAREFFTTFNTVVTAGKPVAESPAQQDAVGA